MLVFASGEGAFAVEVVEVFCFDDIEASVEEFLLEGDDIGLGASAVGFVVDLVAAAPVVGAEGSALAAGVNALSAVGNHGEVEGAFAEFFGDSADDGGVAVVVAPLYEDIDAGEAFWGGGFELVGKDFDGFGVGVGDDGFERSGLLAEAGDDGVGEGFGAYALFGAFGGIDIASVDAVFEGFEEGVFDFGGDFGLADVVEHHASAVEEAGGVGYAFACDIGSGSVDGFEHCDVFADIGGAAESDGACDLGGDIGDDIAVEVEGNDDIEAFGLVGEHSCADVDDIVVGSDFGVFWCDFVEDFMEEAVGELHDIVFGHAGYFFAVVGAGVLEGVADDAFAAGAGDKFEALYHIAALLVFDTCVEVFFVFADDDEVHFGEEARYEGGIGFGGADVGEEAQRFADGDV